jgi:hypothetical protein
MLPANRRARQLGDTELGRFQASQREASDHRRGQAMMRLARRASVLITLSLLTSAAPAHGDCAWVLREEELWLGAEKPNKSRTVESREWLPKSGYASDRECRDVRAKLGASAHSTRFAPGSTPGPGSGTSPSAWRARGTTFYTTGMEHSPTSATGTGWERTPWHATQRAAWEALGKASAGVYEGSTRQGSKIRKSRRTRLSSLFSRASSSMTLSSTAVLTRITMPWSNFTV